MGKFQKFEVQRDGEIEEFPSVADVVAYLQNHTELKVVTIVTTYIVEKES